METRDVLLIESRPDSGRAEREALEAAGHRLHRCFPVESSGFPCVALDGGTCPVDEGIDVAVLALDSDDVPTAFETGVSCALRAGVPLTTTYSHDGGPFAAHLTASVPGDAVEAVEAGVEVARAAIESAVRRLASALIHDDVDFDPSDFTVQMRRDGTNRRVMIEGPALGARVQRALCVRMLDVLRGREAAVATVDVAYRVR